MTAKNLFLKLLGIINIVLGVLFFLFPKVLLDILGLGSINFPNGEFAAYTSPSGNLVAFVIMMYAARNVMLGGAVLLVRKGLQNHFWLWGLVVLSFIDAISVLSIQSTNSLRIAAPLWAVAILQLFIVGLAYGLDIAGVMENFFTQSNPKSTKETKTPTTISV